MNKKEEPAFYTIWRVVFYTLLALGILFVLSKLSAWIKGDGGETTEPAAVEVIENVPSEAPLLSPEMYGGQLPPASPVYSATISGEFFGPMDVNYTVVNGLPIMEGDIILDLGGREPATFGLVIKHENRLWPKGIVPYTIDPNLPDQFRIHDAIEHWEEHTSIRFVERSNERNYIVFQPSWGCSSYVGMVGGKQPINLARGCTTGNTIHEIGHALGLWHEQSRADRDEFVTIHYENIMTAFVHNFNQQLNDSVDAGDYDYGSIMHYPRWAFSKNGKDTIVPRGNEEIGQRDSLSAGDIEAIEELYKVTAGVR